MITLRTLFVQFFFIFQNYYNIKIQNFLQHWEELPTKMFLIWQWLTKDSKLFSNLFAVLLHFSWQFSSINALFNELVNISSQSTCLYIPTKFLYRKILKIFVCVCCYLGTESCFLIPMYQQYYPKSALNTINALTVGLPISCILPQV